MGGQNRLEITRKQMKYLAITLMMCLVVACQRAVPSDVLLGSLSTERQSDGSPSTLTDDRTATNSEIVPSETVAISSTGISEEQDFEVVANSQTIESDAERIAANRAKYIVFDVQKLPIRGLTGPNVVEYAIRTDNPLGIQIYKRLVVLGDSVASQWRCDRFLSSDLAQKAFLSRGGPERDILLLDPDGDGFACAWDPRPFRLAVKN
jgi:hypothetical protein